MHPYNKWSWSISTWYILSIRPDYSCPCSFWCQDSLVAGEVSGTSCFVWLALYEKCSPDTGLYDGRLGTRLRVCALGSNKCPLNEGSNIWCLCIVQGTSKQVMKQWQILKWMTDDDTERWVCVMMIWKTWTEYGTWIWLRKWSWVRKIVSVLYAHPYVHILQKGHPDSGL